MYTQSPVQQYVREGFEIVRANLLSPTEDDEETFNARLRAVMDHDEIKLIGIELLLRLSEIDHSKLFRREPSITAH